MYLKESQESRNRIILECTMFANLSFFIWNITIFNSSTVCYQIIIRHFMPYLLAQLTFYQCTTYKSQMRFHLYLHSINMFTATKGYSVHMIHSIQNKLYIQYLLQQTDKREDETVKSTITKLAECVHGGKVRELNIGQAYRAYSKNIIQLIFLVF